MFSVIIEGVSVVPKTSCNTKAARNGETNEEIYNLLCYHIFEGGGKYGRNKYTSNHLKTCVDHLKHLYMDYSHCSGDIEQDSCFSKYLY